VRPKQLEFTFHKPPAKFTFRAFLCWELQLESCSLSSKTGSYLMAKNAAKRRTWTAEHVRTLKALARNKTRAARIAKKLKRTEGATRQKAFSMGLSLDSRA
jgi:hypothetical protein